jgi:hypothetical protein
MLNRTSKLLLALLAAAAPAAGQDAAPAQAEAAVTPAAGESSDVLLAPRRADTAPRPPADSDGTTRTVSPGIAAALSESMPKYSPPTPTPAATAEPQDMRDIDKPKNEIPRLPKYVVHEARPPVFRNRDLYTPAELIQLSLKAHPGLRIGNLFGLNNDAARDMLWDDERQQDISDLNDTAHAMALGGDPAEGRYILQETQDTYMRTPDLNWGGPGGGGGFSGDGRK